MSADSEKPNIIGGNWTKYCTGAKSVGRGRPIWTSVVVRARARRLRSAAGSINSGRHILESRCAERCANDAFLTSFRATLTNFPLKFFMLFPQKIPIYSYSLVQKSQRWPKTQTKGGRGVALVFGRQAPPPPPLICHWLPIHCKQTRAGNKLA